VNWHIASLVVRCRPDRTAALHSHFDQAPECSVRAAANGRLVLLVEGENEYLLADRLAMIRATPGVLAADLVHHEIDTDEVADDLHAP
jgi:nitrate reductase NapAB chaperone NapD